MAKENDRFIKTYSQGGFMRTMEIWVDRQTGVNYICTQNGNSGGMTPLLSRYGTPVITPLTNGDSKKK